MTKRMALVLAAGLATAVSTALLWRMPPAVTGAELLFAERIPQWQVQRSAELRRVDSPAARAMLRTARPWPALAEALEKLDRSYPDDVRRLASDINRAARAEAVPFWLDVQTLKGRDLVLSYRVDGVEAWRSGATTVEIVRLRRVDRLNVSLGILGQATANGPVVLLDRIEDEWVEQLAAAPDADRDPVTTGLDALIVDLAAQLDPARAGALVTALRERRARFDVMEGRMRVVVPRPSGLVWPPAWFAEIETMTTFQQGRAPLVFASDLRAVREANHALDRADLRAAFAAMVDLRAGGVAVHETRHAIDDPTPPLPAFLRDHPDPAFARAINQELRAYLGELHDTPQGGCLGLVALLRAAYLPKARATPHLFAGRIIARTLEGPANALAGLADADGRAFDDRFPEVDPVALARSQCRPKPPAVRDKVALIWKSCYGVELPLLARLP